MSWDSFESSMVVPWWTTLGCGMRTRTPQMRRDGVNTNVIFGVGEWARAHEQPQQISSEGKYLS